MHIGTRLPFWSFGIHRKLAHVTSLEDLPDMKPVSFLFAVALVGAATFAAAPHRGFARGRTTAQLASPIPASSTVDASPAAVVDTKNYAYAPDPVTIKTGETVLFKNSDAVAHTVAADDASFDSGEMAANASWSHTFAKAGTFTYYCAYHRYMRGTVIVE